MDLFWIRCIFSTPSICVILQGYSKVEITTRNVFINISVYVTYVLMSFNLVPLALVSHKALVLAVAAFFTKVTSAVGASLLYSISNWRHFAFWFSYPVLNDATTPALCLDFPGPILGRIFWQIFVISPPVPPCKCIKSTLEQASTTSCHIHSCSHNHTTISHSIIHAFEGCHSITLTISIQYIITIGTVL
jgi:hypothetical protein